MHNNKLLSYLRVYAFWLHNRNTRGPYQLRQEADLGFWGQKGWEPLP